MKILLLDSGIGIIPFIKEIIKQHKNNEYYLYMDNENFPYGNKRYEELKIHLEKIIHKFSFVDEIYICCNTLSLIYLKEFKYKYHHIFTIADINLQHKENKEILCTKLSKEILNEGISSPLASYIENNNLLKIISFIKNLNKEKEYLLMCTHYSLIKEIYKNYQLATYSYESELINKIKAENTLIFYILPSQIHLIKKYFININIDLYTLS